MSAGRPIRLLRTLFAFPVVAYRHVVSPHLPAACRYTPTCSRYAEQSILKHGFLRGTALGLARILRCNGFFHGGDDPVPEQFSWAYLTREYRARRASRCSGTEHHDQDHLDGT
ncbi:MAG: membrane protein insertion efficiency factor YidD [Spirochaetia bacterium]